MELLHEQFYGNALLKWLVSLGVFFIAWVGFSILKSVAVSRIKVWTQKTETDVDDFFVGLLDGTKSFFIIVLALTIAALYLDLSQKLQNAIHSLFIVSVLLQAALWGRDTIDFFVTRLLAKRAGKSIEDPSVRTTGAALRFIAQIAFYSLIGLLILDNLGFNVTALIASLGVGGIAVALAAQNILGDLFASLSIVFDKPFVLGDAIAVGEQRGVVEKIGLKTTRLKSLTGEQLIISNNDLLSSRIQNYQRMQERRVAFTISVTYQTPVEKLKQIPEMIKGVVESLPKARFERAHFKGFGDSALTFEIVYWMQSGDYAEYVNVENSLNLELVRIFEEKKIDFAYPTQTLFIEKASS